MDTVQRTLHKKHGPLVRLAPDEIGCADPDAIKVIYPTQNPLLKTDFYPVWGPGISKHGDIFTDIDEKHHAERRKIVNHVYSLSNVLQCESFIDECSELFTKRLGDVADSGKSLDMGTWLQWYSFDVVGKLYFGRMFGFMEHRKDHDSYIESLDTMFPVLLSAAVAPSYTRPFIFIAATIGSKARNALVAIKHIQEAAINCVNMRVEKGYQPGSGRDLLQQLLDIVEEKGDKVDFGIPEVQNEAWMAFVAGSDSTAIATRAILYFLLQHQDALRRVRSEIDEALLSGNLSDPVRYAEAIRLPFFCACVKESMRLHPSVGLLLPRIVPAGGLEIAGTYISAGYKIGINAAVVHRDTNVFGPDANEFRPERWLERDTIQMDKTILTFGAGTRTCIGKNISLSEIYKIVPQILRHYDIELAPNAKWKTTNHWWHKQTGFKVLVKRRN